MVFRLSDVEFKKYKEWYDEHYKTCVYLNYHLAESKGCPTAAIAGVITFEFHPTSVGVAVGVKCVCGVSVNCTDYDSW